MTYGQHQTSWIWLLALSPVFDDIDMQYIFSISVSPSIKWASTSKYLWRRQWHPTTVLLPGKSHGGRSVGGCSPWGRWESDTTERLHFHFSLFTFMHWRTKWQATPVFLTGESQGQRSLGGLLSMGSHRVGHDWSDLAAAAAAVNTS